MNRLKSIDPESNLARILRNIDREYASRIIACVNNCEGISPSAVPILMHAARALVNAYHRAEEDGASIDWEDIDEAHRAALEALKASELD